ncbi:hypothetical protein U0070_011128, partial [Myodes glareolus]
MPASVVQALLAACYAYVVGNVKSEMSPSLKDENTQQSRIGRLLVRSPPAPALSPGLPVPYPKLDTCWVHPKPGTPDCYASADGRPSAGSSLRGRAAEREMGNRIEDLQKNVDDLMAQAGIENSIKEQR